MDERNVIHRMHWQGYSNAEIALCLGRHRSSIGRECKRNRSGDGRYYPGNAQTLAHSRRRAHLHRPKTDHSRPMTYVVERLTEHWSPEQIAGRLSVCPPAEMKGLTITHTTIYRWIWSDRRRAQQL
jgi:IS30 family transposase